MTQYRYSYQGEEKNTVRAVGRLLPISFKMSTQVAKFIRGRKLEEAIKLLKQVQEKRVAVPYFRYRRDTPHRRGDITSGRYPIIAANEIRNLLLGLKSNALDTGMKPENVVLVHAVAQKGPTLWHYGRKQGTKRKVCNFEIIGEEVKTERHEAKVEEKKTEHKPEHKAVEVKTERKEQKHDKLKSEHKEIEEHKAGVKEAER